ncbi:helix-turn-helix domain-containing protein [Tissierella creatinini]|nr:helix-turn-helix domain-containing protein [Tissierella creatinini]TJX61938.1 helix-turn-helix domain-containing protein [Soehngenia saccharolytica]
MNLENKDKDIIINALTESLPTLRKQLDLSQQDLAKALSISRQTLVNIENKRSKMNWITAFALLMFFALNPLTLKLLKPLGLFTDNLLKTTPILNEVLNLFSRDQEKNKKGGYL